MSQWSHLYNNRAWKRRRKAQLDKFPLCAYCLRMGKVVPATVGDHIKPHRGDPVLFAGPLQSLCKFCHDSVKAREEGLGMQLGCDLIGAPIDPCHPWNCKP